MSEANVRKPLRVAVDLTPLQPGGLNGGVKPFIVEYLGWLGRQRLHPLQFIFLTRRRSHGEVRAMARSTDELVCILDDPEGGAIHSQMHSPRERTWFDPPDELVRLLGADILYTPLSLSSHHYPGVPMIATAVDVLHRDYPHSLTSDHIVHREAVFREMTAKADLIQGISQYTLDRVAHHYSFPRERMFCSYIAIHERLKPRPIAGAAAANAGRYFLFPANAWKHKNHAGLLLAYGIYRQRLGAEAWGLVLTGHEDEAMRSVLKLAETLGIASQVRFLGHLCNSDYANVWQEAGALVFPSLHEGFGIPIVEAMAFGLPIITSRAGSLPEIGGDACLYVDAHKPLELADAMQRMTRDAGLRSDLQARGHARLKAFSFEADARLFLQKLIACANAPARLTSTGFYPDGWIAPRAAANTPGLGRRTRLEINLRAMPEPRTLRVTQGECLLASFRIPAHQKAAFNLSFIADKRTLRFDVPDASHLSKEDHRCHGVWLESLLLHDTKGRGLNLLNPSS